MLNEIVDENKKLKAALVAREAELARVTSEREQLLKKVASLSRDIELLKRQLYGRKSEKVSEAQLQLALLPVLGALGRLQAGDPAAADDAEKAIADLRGQLEPEPSTPAS